MRGGGSCARAGRAATPVTKRTTAERRVSCGRGTHLSHADRRAFSFHVFGSSCFISRMLKISLAAASFVLAGVLLSGRAGRGRAIWASRRVCTRRALSTPSPTSTACASATRRSSRATRVRTGVTAIVPHGGNVFQDKVAGAVFVGNAFGKLAGSTQVDRARHDRNADRPDEHAQRRRGDGRGRPLHARAARQRAGALGQRAGRRNQRRRAERHPRAPRHARSRARRDPEREDRPGRRRDGRRRHRHDLLRLEGRHRHVVARLPRRGQRRTTRSACWRRPISAAT